MSTRFEIVATGGFLGAEASESWNFTVDTQAPNLRLDRPAVAYAWKPVKVSGSSNEAATIRANDKPVALRDGRFTLRFATPPNGPVLLTATDEVGNTSQVADAGHARAAAPRGAGASRARERGRLGELGAPPGRPAHDRRPSHQRGRARPQGRVRRDRLGRAGPAGEALRRDHGDLRPRGRRRPAAREGRPRDRPSRRVPRPDHGGGRVGRRQPRAGDPGPGRRAVRGLRRLHELRRPGRAEVQRRRRGRRRKARRRRHPLRLRPAAGRPDLLDGLPGPPGLGRAGDRRLPRRDAARRCGRTGRSWARRCSASPRAARSRSRRTSR